MPKFYCGPTLIIALCLFIVHGCGQGSGPETELFEEPKTNQSDDLEIDAATKALLNTSTTQEILLYDEDEDNALEQIAVPSVSVQRQNNYDARRYFGKDSARHLRTYQDYLRSNADFRDLHQSLIELGQLGSQLRAAEAQYTQNAQSVSTNLPFGKGSDYWLAEAQKAQIDYNKLKAAYDQQGPKDILIIGFSILSDDLFQVIRGGTDFDALVAAADAQSVQWNDGLKTPAIDPIEIIAGAGLLKSVGNSILRSVSKAAVVRVSASFIRTFSFSALKQSAISAARGSRALISKLIRACTGLGLVAGKECVNHAVVNAHSVVKNGWIKRSVFRSLNGEAGPQNFVAFQNALRRGVIGPTGQSGIKHVTGPLYELKIHGSAMRILGLVNKDGVVVFTRFVREGLHKSNANEIIQSMLKS